MNRKSRTALLVLLLLLLTGVGVRQWLRAPGRWLEIVNTVPIIARRGTVPFVVQLDVQFSNGTYFRSTIASSTLEGVARVYLSPVSFRRLSGAAVPTTRDIAWFSLTDLTGGATTGGGSEAQPPAGIPPHAFILARC